MPSRTKDPIRASTAIGARIVRADADGNFSLARTLDGTGDGEAVLIFHNLKIHLSVGTPKLLPSNTIFPFAIHRPLRISNEALLPLLFSLDG